MLLEQDPDDGPATELIHFAIHSPRSPYGVPRWVGTLLSVLGSRQMEKVSYLYFENKSVPPLALLVSGGHLSPESVPRIERFIDENLKGKDNVMPVSRVSVLDDVVIRFATQMPVVTSSKAAVLAGKPALPSRCLDQVHLVHPDACTHCTNTCTWWQV